ncbi:MAG: hypothetical protein QG573_51 [Acidobacteriota bacterium]|nr:hypothetical protein [Acidobacteriota bacterium]
MRKAMCIVVGAALLSVAPVLAQKSPDVCEVTFWSAKPGAAAAWAEGRKRHMEFHKQQKDTFTWYAWEVINGDRAGGFLTGTFDHYWKDFDGREAFDALDAADLAKTSGPATAASSDGFWIHLGKASRLKPGATAPAKYLQLTHYYVRPENTPRFEDALEAIAAELTKLDWPVYSSWYRLASGGDGPHYVLSIGRDGYADFAPPEKTMSVALTESMGARQATELLGDLRGSTERLYSEIVRFRPDLSYVPAAK